MRVVIALCLCVVAAQAALQPRNIEIPGWKLNPRHTGAEWAEILANQEFTPEVMDNFIPGTERQIDGAGAIRGDSVDPSIIGGSAAVKGQFPWQVSVRMDGSYFCGGSIISSTWILTAGHCVDGITSFVVGAGTLSSSGGDADSVSQTSRTAILHENYNSLLIINDIGLIKLPAAYTWTDAIGPVRLPSHSQANELLEGERVRVSGWGKTSDGVLAGVSPVLNFVDLNVITNALCAQTYGISVRASNICTLGDNKESTCNGDSGGPLVFQEADGLNTHVGIVSFGSSAGCTLGYPAAFTRTTSYLGWIETNTGIIIA